VHAVLAPLQSLLVASHALLPPLQALLAASHALLTPLQALLVASHAPLTPLHALLAFLHALLTRLHVLLSAWLKQLVAVHAVHTSRGRPGVLLVRGAVASGARVRLGSKHEQPPRIAVNGRHDLVPRTVRACSVARREGEIEMATLTGERSREAAEGDRGRRKDTENQWVIDST
jgi:hypothetical protein